MHHVSRQRVGPMPLTLALAVLMLFVSGSPFVRPASAQTLGAWSPLPTIGAPSPRYLHSAIWTGSEMLIWGDGAAGAAYDPAANTWRPLPTAGAPSPRYHAAVVWTGSELLVWGGYGFTKEANGDLGDGAAYRPATNSWRPLSAVGAPSPRSPKVAVWTGKELLVWGSDQGAPDGAAYNPATDAWRPLPTAGAPSPGYPTIGVWTGTELLVWVAGGQSARYRPATNTWSPLAADPALGLREWATGVWDGTALLVWGGAQPGPGANRVALGAGAAYDPASDTWTPLPAAGAPRPRFWQTGVWDGTELLIWGGVSGSGALGDGGAFNPSTGAWRPLPIAGAPSPRCQQTAVWTGAQMLIWGGTALCDVMVQPLNTGAAYTPQPPPTCRYVLGFATLHAARPAIIGGCLDDERHDPANGDALQHTAHGLLVWRKADNFTAFTDGYRTWVTGPNGTQERLNNRRFPWEANPAHLPLA